MNVIAVSILAGRAASIGYNASQGMAAIQIAFQSGQLALSIVAQLGSRLAAILGQWFFAPVAAWLPAIMGDDYGLHEEKRPSLSPQATWVLVVMGILRTRAWIFDKEEPALSMFTDADRAKGAQGLEEILSYFLDKVPCPKSTEWPLKSSYDAFEDYQTWWWEFGFGMAAYPDGLYPWGQEVSFPEGQMWFLSLLDNNDYNRNFVLENVKRHIDNHPAPRGGALTQNETMNLLGIPVAALPEATPAKTLTDAPAKVGTESAPTPAVLMLLALGALFLTSRHP